MSQNFNFLAQIKNAFHIQQEIKIAFVAFHLKIHWELNFKSNPGDRKPKTSRALCASYAMHLQSAILPRNVLVNAIFIPNNIWELYLCRTCIQHMKQGLLHQGNIYHTRRTYFKGVIIRNTKVFSKKFGVICWSHGRSVIRCYIIFWSLSCYECTFWV